MVESSQPVVTACTVTVRFSIPYRVELGEHVIICGNCPELGNWKEERGLHCVWGPGHLWTSQTRLPPGNYEYKAWDRCLSAGLWSVWMVWLLVCADGRGWHVL